MRIHRELILLEELRETDFNFQHLDTQTIKSIQQSLGNRKHSYVVHTLSSFTFGFITYD